MNQHQDDLYQEARMGLLIEQQEINLFATLKPKFCRDGNQWCVLLGDDIQSGICGFGDTLMQAIYEFNKAFHSPLNS